MVISADFPPFAFFDTNKTPPKIVGFDIDIAKRIGDYLGYEIEVKDVEFSVLIPSLQSGRADFAMSGITPTEERAKSVAFSQPYYFMNNMLVHKQDNDFVSREDFEGKRVAATLGTTQEEFAKSWAAEHPGVTIVILNRANDAIQELLSGRVDGVILDETPAGAFVSKNSKLLTMQNLEGESFASAIAFPKNSKHVDEFNRALNHLNETGELDEIIKKWLVGQ